MKHFNKIQHISGRAFRSHLDDVTCQFISSPISMSFSIYVFGNSIYVQPYSSEFALRFRSPWTFCDVIDYMFEYYD